MLISLICLLFFIGLQGLFAGMETGLISVRRPRIEYAVRKKKWTAKLVLFFLNRPGRMIATTLLGVNISVVCASLSAKSFAESAGLHGGVGLLILTGGLSIILLICEIIPKSWFRQSPCDRCARFIPVLYALYLILYLPVRLFDEFTAFLSRCFSSRKGNAVKSAVLREDMRLFLRESESGGDMPPEAASLLDNTIASASIHLSEIMTPLEQICDISPEMDVNSAIRLCREKSWRRLPVRTSEESGSPWCGIFTSYHAMLLLPEKEWRTTRVRSIMQPLLSLDGNITLIEALMQTRNARASLFVVTRNQKPIGIFTLSDLAKKLFV